jgi:excisionase family DNA binding protein
MDKCYYRRGAMGDIMLTAEVARFLGKSSETIRLYARRGKLPATQTDGGMRLFKREDVLRLAELLGKQLHPVGIGDDPHE